MACLNPDPTRRPSAEQLMNMPYFAGLDAVHMSDDTATPTSPGETPVMHDHTLCHRSALPDLDPNPDDGHESN